MAKNANLRSPNLLFVLFGIVVVLIIAKLFFLNVIVGDQYRSQALESRTSTIETTAKRGTIYDRNGVVLAASVDATTVYCNPNEVKNVSKCASTIAECLGGKDTDYLDALTKNNTTFAYIKRQADVDAAKKLKEKVGNDEENLSGIYFLKDSKREYPNGEVAGQIIGICDVDGNGICGLELKYDKELKGEGGKYVAERSENGSIIPGAVKENKTAVAGDDIMVTLDIVMQGYVEKSLSAQVERLGSKSGSAILMNSANGEIYSMCSYPYLNPANTENSEVGSDNVSCITQAIEPGSMMKTCTALGLLQANVMQPEDKIACPASIKADEYYIKDARERGAQTMSLDQILTTSSNVGISLASDKLGHQKIAENIIKSKLLEKTGVDFPGEASGNMSDVSTWSKIEGYNITFGQGITTTPIEMTRFYAAIANDGIATTPHFLLARMKNAEKVSYDTVDLGYSKDALSKIKGMLRNVVKNNSENKSNIDGYEVCGKTSTAEFSDGGKYVDGRYNLGYCSFLNNASEKFVCYAGAMDVRVESNMTGVCGDIMKEAISRYRVVPLSTNAD